MGQDRQRRKGDSRRLLSRLFLVIDHRCKSGWICSHGLDYQGFEAFVPVASDVGLVPCESAKVVDQVPARDADELIERLYAVNSRAIDLTEALLLLSRTEQKSFTPGCVDLSLLAEEAAEQLLPLAEKRGVTIETSAEKAQAIGSETLLLKMILNLLHNSIVHNLSDHGSVWIRTRASPNGAVLTVENTGEPLDKDSVSTLVEPFHRGAERLHGDHAGAGLGLAVKEHRPGPWPWPVGPLPTRATRHSRRHDLRRGALVTDRSRTLSD